MNTLWANEQHYYPLHVLLYTPVDRFEEGKEDPAFRTKPQLALTLIESALAAGVAFKAIVADAFYGDYIGLARVLTLRGLPEKATWCLTTNLAGEQASLAKLSGSMACGYGLRKVTRE